MIIEVYLIPFSANILPISYNAPISNLATLYNFSSFILFGFEEESYLDLFQAVMELDKKYRVPVLLFYYERYSTAEIASILKMPEKTVSTRLFRAKAKLKNYLKEE